jgi:hopanoid-associated phosphorylase
MQSEERLLPAGVLVRCTGGIPERAKTLAAELMADGAEALVSFGVAGGLAPEVPAGTLIVGTGVDLGGATLMADTAWFRRLCLYLPAAIPGVVAATDLAAVTPDEKFDLYEASGAIAVDMESGALAEACLARGIPFAILRAVADPAHRSIPLSALAGLEADGSLNPMAVLKALSRSPGDIPGLLRLAIENQKALGALRLASRRLGPLLGFDSL